MMIHAAYRLVSDPSQMEYVCGTHYGAIAEKGGLVTCEDCIKIALAQGVDLNA